MNKHLPGRHNQKMHGIHWNEDAEYLVKHGSSSHAASIASNWKTSGMKGKLGDFADAVDLLPHVIGTTMGNNTSLDITLGVNPMPTAAQVDLTVRDGSAYIGLTLNRSLSDTRNPWAFLGADKADELLTKLEALCQGAGCKSIISNTHCLPTLLAAKHGWLLNEDVVGSRPYRYLNEVYGLAKPDMGEQAKGSYSINEPLWNVLQKKHANRNTLSLYMDFLCNMLSGEDPLRGPDTILIKKLL